MEVDFITLGDASERIKVPPPTLRHWTDQLEEFETHYVLRNNRNERIYYDEDLEIFAFLKAYKNEFGRRTTTKDLAYMIAEKGKEGEFKLRSKEESPTIERSNKTADLLNQEDIQRLMQSERVKQFIGIVIAENTKNLREELIEEVREVVREELKGELEANTAKMEEISSKMQESVEKRDKQTTDFFNEIRESRNNNKSWWEKLIGK